MDWVATFSGILAVGLLAGDYIKSSYIAFMIGNISWILYGFPNHQYAVATSSVFMLIINIYGLYRRLR